MIAHITGTIAFRGSTYVVIDVEGVGYKIFATPETILGIGEENASTTLYTHMAVRETAMDLYGFRARAELAFFELLITISGIGPKSALGILSVAPVDTLKKAIVSGDTSYLIKVSGIGKKNAEKIVLELRDKLTGGISTTSSSTELREETDTLEALQSLGYSLAEARSALKDIPENIVGTNKRIGEALKRLGRQ
ncbi:MAG: Holliday junction branch migration protein RuvA [Candidatus Yonathbacteria bacterium]|nr:Holliday junction branch migration protein RuvA [Candidatus Yonathbacteria bacterium]NTW47667.1 Holliday junction branch migration protein RuvA [Candidatus Yonathbacteria bacterium]